MEQLSFNFRKPRPELAREDNNDYHRVPASEKQIHYARTIAARLKSPVPHDALGDRAALSAWIEKHKKAQGSTNLFAQYPSSKQVAFAERIARIKRRSVPDACFKDRTMMSRWIDSNR